MGFKENLLKKIHINNLAKQVIDSIGPPDSGRKIDKVKLRSLIELSSYDELIKKRDLELYVSKADPQINTILVLDNELAIYKTTVEDVVLRKSPLIKEMLNIKNIIKILNDADVIVSKKTDSVKTLQNESIAKLDLSFEEADLDKIIHDGIASLEREYTEGVMETMALFAEILDFKPPPKQLKIKHNKMIGALVRKENGDVLYGPIVIYSIIYNKIKLIDEQINISDKDKVEMVHHIASGKKIAPMEGTDVFVRLKQAVLKKIG
jgi:hypothetical protein